MSLDRLEQFRQLVLRDAALQERLREPSSQADFVARLQQLGREHGYDFTADDVAAALNAARRAWFERWM